MSGVRDTVQQNSKWGIVDAKRVKWNVYNDITNGKYGVISFVNNLEEGEVVTIGMCHYLIRETYITKAGHYHMWIEEVTI